MNQANAGHLWVEPEYDITMETVSGMRERVGPGDEGAGGGGFGEAEAQVGSKGQAGRPTPHGS